MAEKQNDANSDEVKVQESVSTRSRSTDHARPVSGDLEKLETVDPTSQVGAKPDFPEGGWRAWATVAGA